MIISHRYKYLFIEVPQTGSTSIAEALVESYAGESILLKHSCYYEFLRQAGDEEKKYFTFATVRNPLEIIVSKYCKAASDHNMRYSLGAVEPASTWVGRSRRASAEYECIVKRKATFLEYFNEFYRLVYNNRCALLPPALDYLLRFERLQEQFSEVLAILKIDEVDALPGSNKTRKGGTVDDYFSSPESRARACRLCGPFMEKWGYTSPSGWPPSRVTVLQRALFGMDALCRTVFYRWFHPGMIKRRAGGI